MTSSCQFNFEFSVFYFVGFIPTCQVLDCTSCLCVFLLKLFGFSRSCRLLIFMFYPKSLPVWQCFNIWSWLTCHLHLLPFLPWFVWEFFSCWIITKSASVALISGWQLLKAFCFIWLLFLLSCDTIYISSQLKFCFFFLEQGYTNMLPSQIRFPSLLIWTLFW